MEDRLAGLRAGIDDYITKPFSATYLKQRVENIVESRKLLQQSLLANVNVNVETGGSSEDLPAEGSNDGNVYKLEAPQIVDTDKKMMEKLMEYLNQHIGEAELRIEDLADAVGMGRTSFYSKLKTIVGMTPVDFVRHIRIQRAEYLIIHSNDTFSQVAYAVGFSDPKYFSRCFKKETGMTPSEYKKIKT
jgi:AraC-like DNA-binding protein